MTSRLDRLFVLLEAGAGSATRQAAARQLGEVQKAHPEELHRLLARLMQPLRSNIWETRVAAAQAVEAILANVPEWQPPVSNNKDVKQEDIDGGRLRCEQLDIERVLNHGAHLMASEGHEFDFDDEGKTTKDVRERLARQRAVLNAKLGLDIANKLGIEFGEVCTTEDLCPTPKPIPKQECIRRPVQELMAIPTDKKLSSREMNVAKRKARQAAFNKQKSRDASIEEQSAPTTPTDEPDCKRIKLEPWDEYLAEAPRSEGVWPLQCWSECLSGSLLSASWETRHGAASALRELLKAKVSHGAGRRHVQDEDGHQSWLEDLALRLLCVLALDRFGDFVSDQVVAPVRETCAQALGVVASRMRDDRVALLLDLLAQLTKQSQWEARHGALLGFKYLLQAKPEVSISNGALEYLISGLDDVAEDVSAVAAGALVPAVGALCGGAGAEGGSGARRVSRRLWCLLLEQDELAAPANSYMALLAALMSLPEAATLFYPIDLEDVLPRLWPYLQHNSSSVRKAALQTLRTITKPLRSEDDNTEEDVYLPWSCELLQTCMRHVYHRILYEHVQDIQDVAMQVWRNMCSYSSLSTLLMCGCPLLCVWLCAAMQSPRIPVEPDALPERRPRPGALEAGTENRPTVKWYIGGSETQHNDRERNITRARCRAAQALGLLSCYLVQPAPGIDYEKEADSPIDCYVKVIVTYLSSSSALQRLVASLVVSSWAHHTFMQQAARPIQNGGFSMDHVAPPLLKTTLHTILNQMLYYDEVALNCNKVLQEARDLVAMMKHYKLPMEGNEFTNITRLEQVSHITAVSQPLLASLKIKRVASNLEERRASLQYAVNQCAIEQNAWHISVQAAIAGACAYLHALPDKLNPVIRPLMESLKKEEQEELQLQAARALGPLLAALGDRQPCPNHKVLGNLKAYLRCDPEYTPKIALSDNNVDEVTESASGDSSNEGSDVTTPTTTFDKYSGILTLWEQQRAAERMGPKRGRPPLLQQYSLDVPSQAHEDESRKLLRIQRRGATLALTSLTEYFGEELPEKLPKLWEFITEPVAKVMTDDELDNQDVEAAEELISRLQVIETVSPHLHEQLWQVLLKGTDALAALTRHRLTSVRHMGARCFSVWGARSASVVMHCTAHTILSALTHESARVRCGAAETLARLADALQLQLVPYISLLVLPLLGRMSDQCSAVRVMSTRCFASLIQLMPLDGAVDDPEGLSPELLQRRERDKKFLDQLFNPKSIKDYKIPVPVSAELRSYQQAGVNWLRFLNEYQLHGVLCDDMGLGKTLQSIVVMAGDHVERKEKYKQTGDKEYAPIPSLVVCPPTLIGHWVFEVNKFISKEYLKPLQFVGPPVERERLRSLVANYNLVVASYDIVRKDIDFFSSIRWNYCILDEGHVVKNGKTKAFKAIKRLVANHRLILSGTPIQNNVLELWSLFDFLMPGLLGTERQFTAKYSRPILLAREPKPTTHQLQAGARAVEALHRQVLPFLLRRVKEDVLKELPAKITQDYYCELSPLQRKLYEHCSKAHPTTKNTPHVFQALHYLQNVCNHPKLVLSPDHPAHALLMQELSSQRSSLDDINHAAKLPALKQLLLDCGIGAPFSDNSPVISQHRALIFCQLKSMLSIVERDLLQMHLPTVTYLRVDGSVPPVARQGIVNRFNNDPSIDLLLLTTAVGGLGLNLTGADTVIFVEHDWNPMKDLQAMDRAHRIGQRKVVNVYRLITRGTLEEKIMGLQKFKVMTANTVISKENAALETMGTDKLLDLFQLSSDAGAPGTPTTPGVAQASLPGTSKSVLDSLPDLWDDKQYEEEYDMSNFIKTLHKMNS